MNNVRTQVNLSILFFFALSLSACAPAVPVTPQASATVVVPSPILTQTMQPTETLSPTLTAQPSDTPTADVQGDVLVAPLVQSNCRSLPYGTSRVVGYLRNGQVAVAQGVDAGGEWISIENPDKKDGSNCWVLITTLKTEGDLSTLSYVSASPQ